MSLRESLGLGADASRSLFLLGMVVLVALIGMVDYWTGPEITLSIIFLLPIGLGAWFLGARPGLLLGCLSSVAWFLAERHGGFHYSSQAILYWNASVRLGFFLIIAAAVSARRRTEKRILELMSVKSAFTSMVSHELRTPLTCIKEGIDIVSDGTCGELNPDQREHLETAKRNVDRLARLLNDVLDYQKLEARRLRKADRPIDLNRICADALEAFSLAARKKDLELEAQLDPALPPVQGDPDRLTQVVGNLLSNAVKYSERGLIVLTTRTTDDGARVAIRDQGPGIAREDLPRLFQAFTQLAPAVGRRREGTGLGLAIARQIVELHGGRIQVESVLGEGSTFSFWLPGAPWAEEADPRATSLPQAPGTG